MLNKIAIYCMSPYRARGGCGLTVQRNHKCISLISLGLWIHSSHNSSISELRQ